ncbi:MAG: UPF0280 family protein [Candidatus Omnitrophota bacterium]
MTERFYRSWSKSSGLVSFKAAVAETDLFISAGRDLTLEAIKAIKEARLDIEEYIRAHPYFKETLEPVPLDKAAPQIVKQMIDAGLKALVGPMAAVAGAVAEAVGRKLLGMTKEIIVENGGDIYINSKSARKIGIYAGPSPLSNKVGIEIKSEDTPCGVCTSSATVGPSLSFGRTDATVIYSRNCALADAAATAVGNIVQTKDEINDGLNLAKGIKGVEGALIIIKDAMGAWGKIKIVDIT